MMKEKEEKREFWPLVLLPLWDIFWSTFSSPFYTYYIPFLSSGSQESNASNGVQIGVETKKLWSLQENWTELSRNFAHHYSRCEIHSKVRKSQFKVHQFRTPQSKVRKISHRAKPPPATRVPFRTPQAHFRTVRNKVRIPQSKVWKFRTMQFKVRNSHFKVRKFCYCWTRFWSTSWSSNYEYDMSF